MAFDFSSLAANLRTADLLENLPERIEEQKYISKLIDDTNDRLKQICYLQKKYDKDCASDLAKALGGAVKRNDLETLVKHIRHQLEEEDEGDKEVPLAICVAFNIGLQCHKFDESSILFFQTMLFLIYTGGGKYFLSPVEDTGDVDSRIKAAQALQLMISSLSLNEEGDYPKKNDQFTVPSLEAHNFIFGMLNQLQPCNHPKPLDDRIESILNSFDEFESAEMYVRCNHSLWKEVGEAFLSEITENLTSKELEKSYILK